MEQHGRTLFSEPYSLIGDEFERSIARNAERLIDTTQTVLVSSFGTELKRVQQRAESQSFEKKIPNFRSCQWEPKSEAFAWHLHKGEVVRKGTAKVFCKKHAKTLFGRDWKNVCSDLNSDSGLLKRKLDFDSGKDEEEPALKRHELDGPAVWDFLTKVFANKDMTGFFSPEEAEKLKKSGTLFDTPSKDLTRRIGTMQVDARNPQANSTGEVIHT
jgi:hypothetical protein